MIEWTKPEWATLKKMSRETAAIADEKTRIVADAIERCGVDWQDIDSECLNPYEIAARAVLEALREYDAIKK